MTPNPLPSLERFDGAAAWVTLTPEQQAEIGAIAPEYAMCEYGFARIAECGIPEAEGRPFAGGVGPLLTDLENAALDAIDEPAIGNDNISVPIPSRIGPVCRACGCGGGTIGHRRFDATGDETVRSQVRALTASVNRLTEAMNRRGKIEVTATIGDKTVRLEVT